MEEEQEEDEERVAVPLGPEGISSCVVATDACMGMPSCTCMGAWRPVGSAAPRPREKRRSEPLPVPVVAPPAELELVVAVLDWREGVRREGGAGVRIMGMVSPWQLRNEKRMGGCVGCFGRRHVQQYTATSEPTTTNATKIEPTIRKGT